MGFSGRRTILMTQFRLLSMFSNINPSARRERSLIFGWLCSTQRSNLVASAKIMASRLYIQICGPQLKKRLKSSTLSIDVWIFVMLYHSGDPQERCVTLESTMLNMRILARTPKGRCKGGLAVSPPNQRERNHGRADRKRLK